jgi:hypothetical protein
MTPARNAAPDLVRLAAIRCKVGAPKLTPAELAAHLQSLIGWTEAGGGTQNEGVCAAKTDRLCAG